jgi:hypothetical protein
MLKEKEESHRSALERLQRETESTEGRKRDLLKNIVESEKRFLGLEVKKAELSGVKTARKTN